jgi:HD-like signal output (HDOD) protein
LGLKEAEEPFAAALLQDMAVPLLAKELPELYAKLLDKRDGGRVRLSAFERQLFGWTHADAAAMMARQWNLPDEFIELVKQHPNIKTMLEGPKNEPGQLAVAMSSLLPANSDDGWPECVQFDEYFQRILPAGGPSAVEFLQTVDEEFAEFAPVLKINNPAKSLTESYAEFHELQTAT